MVLIQKWVRFFREAGIEDESAATYADSFVSNRMDMTMLTDLDRDTLKILGVTILGDVIKVTKHAKIVAEKLNSDRIINKSLEDDVKATISPKKIKLKRSESPKSTENSRSPSPQAQQARKRKIATKLDNKETTTTIKSEPVVKLSSRLGPPASNNSTEDTKSSVFKRLGEADSAPKVAKKNVFDRLDGVKQEPESINVDSAKPTSRIVTTSGPSKVVTTSGSTKIISSKVTKDEQRSAFDRLDAKSDSTQVPKVSSSTTPEPMNPGKGILKQRKSGMTKSKSASSIISLKSSKEQTLLRETDDVSTEKKRKIRVSFGHNEYRAVSPRQGIKTRLWGGAGAEGGEMDSSGDEEELKDVTFNKKIMAAQVDDLRQNIKKKQEAKQTEHETKKTEDLRIKVSNTAAMKATVKQADSVGEINKKSTLSDVSAEEDIIPTKKVLKKIYVIRKMSDGTMMKKEIPPEDPRYQAYCKKGVKGKEKLKEAEPVRPNQESMVTKSTLNPSLQSRLSPAVAKPTKTSIETLRPGFQRDSLNQDNQEVRQLKIVSEPKETSLTRTRITEVSDERLPRSNFSPRLSSAVESRQSKNLSVASRLSRRDSDEIEDVRPRQINRISMNEVRHYGENDTRRSRSPQSSRIQADRPLLGGRLQHSLSDSMIQQRISDIRQHRVVDDRSMRVIDDRSPSHVVNSRPRQTDLASQRAERWIEDDRDGHRQVTQRMHSYSPDIDDIPPSERQQPRMREYSPEMVDERSIRLAGSRQESSIRDRMERSEMSVRNHQTVHVNFQQATHTPQARFYDEDIEREIARKEETISRLKSSTETMAQFLARTKSERTYTDADRRREVEEIRSNRSSEDRSRHDSDERSNSYRKESNRELSRRSTSIEESYRRRDDDNRRTGGSKVGTMIADRELKRPAIEDRLSKNSVYRERSRSPQERDNYSLKPRESSGARIDRGSRERSREDDRKRVESGLRTSVRNRLGERY